MPKKSVVNKTAVLEVLGASKEAVKKNLCKELGEKMTPIAVYTFVKLNTTFDQI